MLSCPRQVTQSMLRLMRVCRSPDSFPRRLCQVLAVHTPIHSVLSSDPQVDAEVQKLLLLKKQLKDMSVDDEEVKGRMVLKAPKGMRDFGAHQMQIREKVMSQVVACFKKHGAQGIDTPVCERRDILTGKYGEDSKLIFDLQDQGMNRNTFALTDLLTMNSFRW